MALNVPVFFTRLGSAIVFSAVMMTGLLWNEWAFAALMFLVMVLCLREFFKIIYKIFTPENCNNLIPASILVIAGLLFITVFNTLFLEENIILGKALLGGAVIILTSSLLKSLLQKEEAFKALALNSMSLFYVILPILMLLYLRYLSISIPLALILMIWMNDTMAYLTGSFIGKTPFSKISPKKTWEGTIGGVIFTLVGAAIWGYYSPYYNMIDWMVLALCASIAGTAGDLFESKLKRMADVKDSGAMMPGHGGALDRFDSLLVATPFVFVYAYLFMPPLPLIIF